MKDRDRHLRRYLEAQGQTAAFAAQAKRERAYRMAVTFAREHTARIGTVDGWGQLRPTAIFSGAARLLRWALTRREAA